MENQSAADLLRQSEGLGEGGVLDDPARLDRRRFLKSGALTVAGLATLSGVELVEAPMAMGQLPTTLSPVQNFELVSAGATAVPGYPSLQVCRHHYRFEYTVGQSLPPDLVTTYRLNVGGIGGALADQLQVLAQPAPFTNPSLAPAGFPPQPQGLVGGGGNPSPQSLLGMLCYRLTQVVQLQTFPVRTVVRVWDWCSLYCYPGNVIVIVAGDRCVCYRVGTSQPQPPPPTQKNIVDDRPTLSNFWAPIQSGTAHSIGGVYYYTYNSQTGASSTAVWRAQLNVPEGTQCRVDAFIPGSSAPQNRTAGARYQIFNAGFISANVVRSQQLAQSQWVTLGTFPFRTGTFEVHLTDETGEPRASRIVVADAVRWVG
jgi:hypothetical protein